MFFSLHENNVAKNCSFVHGNFNQLKPDIQIKVTKFHNPKNGSNFEYSRYLKHQAKYACMILPTVMKNSCHGIRCIVHHLLM